MPQRPKMKSTISVVSDLTQVGRCKLKQQNDRDNRKRGIDPEHRLPSESLREQAAEHWTGGTGQRRCRCPYADRRRSFGLWKSRTDQREACRRQQRGSNSLQDARRDEPTNGPGKRTAGGRSAEQEATNE